MPLSNNINHYADCKSVWDTVVQMDGGSWEAATKSDAIYMRQRLHKFRRLHNDMLAEVRTPGNIPTSAYDAFKIVHAETVLTFVKREVQGVLRGPHGEVVTAQALPDENFNQTFEELAKFGEDDDELDIGDIT